MAIGPGSRYSIGFDVNEFGMDPTVQPTAVAVFASRWTADDPDMSFSTPVTPEPGRWLAEAKVPTTWLPGEEITVWARATYAAGTVVRRLDRFAVADPRIAY